jgi:lipoprotein Spr
MSIIFTLILFFISSAGNAFELPREVTGLHRNIMSENPPPIRNTVPSPDHILRIEIMEEYQKWRGTPYHFGGSSRQGVDCSALMQHVFRESTNFFLPRTTNEQIRRGITVKRDNLRIGDLVFFHQGPQQRHVGVYIGNDEFIHASSIEGVTISTLKNQYWHTRFITARRIVS